MALTFCDLVSLEASPWSRAKQVVHLLLQLYATAGVSRWRVPGGLSQQNDKPRGSEKLLMLTDSSQRYKNGVCDGPKEGMSNSEI